MMVLMKIGALIGIHHGVLADINNNAKGKYGWHFDVIPDTKYAMITSRKRR